MTIADNTILGEKYRLIRQLDEGAMGSVWLAEHVSLRSPVAIKLIAPGIAETEDGLQRFFREARTAAALRNPHVVQILDYGVQQGVPYIVMELLEGEPLSVRLQRLGKLSPSETERVLRHVSRALSRAHDAGIVHRDLKPANVFIVVNEEEEVIKLLDFGIAKARVDVLTASMASNTRTGVFLGTPFYMSPEQVEGSKTLDFRADIWGLGVLAYECLLGSLPFNGETFGGLVLAICSRPLPIPSERGPVPAGFDAWFACACAREPAQRFPSAREAVAELRRLTEGARGAGELSPPQPASALASRVAQMAVAPVFPAEPTPSGEAARRTPPPALAETDGGASRAATPGQSGTRNQRALIGAAVLAVGVLFFSLVPRAGDSSPGSRPPAKSVDRLQVKTGIHVRGEAGYTLSVDGRRVGVLPLEPIALEPGAHQIAISGGPGDANHEERVVVAPGRVAQIGPVVLKARTALAQRPAAAPIAMPSAGASGSSRSKQVATLSVDSTPASRVLLDGRLLGVTPISNLAIEPGAHDVVFIHGVETRVKTINVAAGKIERLDVKF